MEHTQSIGTLCAIGALSVASTSGSLIASEFVPESRDSNLMITFANLGFTKGYDGDGADPILLSSDALDSDDDFISFGDMFYGPDSFDRINTGSFEAVQDVTFEPALLGFEFSAFASVAGEANPLITIDNDMFLYFAVSEDTSATLTVEYDGDTNVGDDAVGCRLREVGPGSDPIILDTLFNLGAFPDGPDTITVMVDLEAGKRYRMFVDSHARSLDSIGANESSINITLELPCDADLNNDGELDFFDLSEFLSNMIDWNGDTVFDFFDISGYLQDYGAGCP
ncbi:MAG: hypothetical protein JJ974_00215 [Phycisphaerales bacterium]|nr:hypothetical protein [Phycisphaerales bacterium]